MLHTNNMLMVLCSTSFMTKSYCLIFQKRKFMHKHSYENIMRFPDTLKTYSTKDQNYSNMSQKRLTVPNICFT